MYNTVFFIILAILVLGFGLERWLEYLNLKNTFASPPEELSDVYETARYQESQKYKRSNTRFSFLTSSFSLLLVLLMLFLGGFALVDRIACSAIRSLHHCCPCLFRYPDAGFRSSDAALFHLRHLRH